MQLADSRMMASVGRRIFGSGTSSQRTSFGPYRSVPIMMQLSFVVGLACPAALCLAFARPPAISGRVRRKSRRR
jgi:hypothetical protein